MDPRSGGPSYSAAAIRITQRYFFCSCVSLSFAKVLLSRCLHGRTPCSTGSLLCRSCRRRDRLVPLGAHAVSPPRDHARGPGSFLRSCTQCRAYAGHRAQFISPQPPAGWLHHGRDRLGLLTRCESASGSRPCSRIIRARSAQGRAWLISPQTPAGWLHHRRDRLSLLGAHAVSPPRGHARVIPGYSCTQCRAGLGLFSPQTPAGWLHHRRDRLGLLGAHAVSPPRDHARGPKLFVHAVQGRARSALTL